MWAKKAEQIDLSCRSVLNRQVAVVLQCQGQSSVQTCSWVGLRLHNIGGLTEHGS